MAIYAMADNNINITVARDAAMYDYFASNVDFVLGGIGNELTCTKSGLTVTVQPGECIIQGRHITVTANTTANVPASRTGYIVMRYNATTVGTEGKFGYVLTLQQEDLNNGGDIRDLPLYRFTSTTSAVTLTDVRDIRTNPLGGLTFSVENGKLYGSYMSNGQKIKKELGSVRPSDLTATQADVLVGKSFVGYNSDEDQIGSMPNRGAVSRTLEPGQSYTVPNGYHNGSGLVRANPVRTTVANVISGATEQTVIPTTGYYFSSVNVGAVQTEEKTVLPSAAIQYVTPTTGKWLSKVTVKAVASEEKTVSAGATAINVVPSSGKLLSKVTVNAISTQTKTVNPSTTTVNVLPDSGKYLSKVTVNRVSVKGTTGGYVNSDTGDLSTGIPCVCTTADLSSYTNYLAIFTFSLNSFYGKTTARYTLEGSNDNATWTALTTGTDSGSEVVSALSPNGYAESVIHYSSVANYSYYRLTVTYTSSQPNSNYRVPQVTDLIII